MMGSLKRGSVGLTRHTHRQVKTSSGGRYAPQWARHQSESVAIEMNAAAQQKVSMMLNKAV